MTPHIANLLARICMFAFCARESAITIYGAKIYELSMPEKSYAFTVGEYIFLNENLLIHIGEEIYAYRLKRILAHEGCHVEQFKRYGFGGAGFIALYFFYQVFIGYRRNPLEIEAREAENYASRK